MARHSHGPQIVLLELNVKSNAKLQAVNGVTIRGRRKQLGWSQVEFGQRAGYSERVIRKAEAGGTLRLQTIKDLAMTLSLGGVLVSFQDLTSSKDPISAKEQSMQPSLECQV
jgi:transcriptional regulator with XRE-family HTH domain